MQTLAYIPDMTLKMSTIFCDIPIYYNTYMSSLCETCKILPAIIQHTSSLKVPIKLLPLCFQNQSFKRRHSVTTSRHLFELKLLTTEEET